MSNKRLEGLKPYIYTVRHWRQGKKRKVTKCLPHRRSNRLKRQGGREVDWALSATERVVGDAGGVVEAAIYTCDCPGASEKGTKRQQASSLHTATRSGVSAKGIETEPAVWWVRGKRMQAVCPARAPRGQITTRLINGRE